jgi:hypothetical protein
VVRYVKGEGNRAAKRHFMAKNMICEHRRQEEELLKSQMNKHCFHTHTAKLPNLETEVRSWVTDHRHTAVSFSTTIIIS